MNSNRRVCLLLVSLLTSASLASENCCARKDSKEPPEHYRGWIGGQYKLAKQHWNWVGASDAVYAFPKSLTNRHEGILITHLGTNTPAHLAGLREADLILEIDGDKMTSLSQFHKKIDQKKPGVALNIKAFRDGALNEFEVRVGRETFREQGMFGVGLPFGLPATDFKFNPNFSLIALGFTKATDKRTELDSAEQSYRRENSKEYHPADPYWRAWLGPFVAMRSREILAQEVVARDASLL